MAGQIWLLGCYSLAPALKRQSILVCFLSCNWRPWRDLGRTQLVVLKASEFKLGKLNLTVFLPLAGSPEFHRGTRSHEASQSRPRSFSCSETESHVPQAGLEPTAQLRVNLNFQSS